MQLFQKYSSIIRHFFSTRYAQWKTYSLRTRLSIVGIGAIFCIALLSGGILLSNEQSEAVESEATKVPEVSVQSIAALASRMEPIPLVGIVRSTNEATLSTESSGRIVGVYRALGDTVAAGSIIAEIENSSQRAQVLQAEASLKSAEASLAKVAGGSRFEQQDILRAALEAAQQQAVTSILLSFETVEDAIPRKTDALFHQPTTSSPKYLPLSTDALLVGAIESERPRIGTILDAQNIRTARMTTNADLAAELTRTQDELRSVRAYLDKIVEILNKAIPNASYSTTDISTFLANATAARTSITNALNTLSTSRNALESARQNLAQGITGGQPEDVAIAAAQVLQAEATLAQAQAALGKTLIRAPFSGTINALSLERGNFVSQFEPVVTIANNALLEVRTSVTERDRDFVQPGATVTTEGGARGIVTKISPALDPVTKRIEVHISITAGGASFTNGQSIRLFIERENTTTTYQGVPSVPLTAITFIAGVPQVLIPDSAGILSAVPVTLGTILGDRVEVLDIPDTTRIVVDARGLAVGDTIIVK